MRLDPLVAVAGDHTRSRAACRRATTGGTPAGGGEPAACYARYSSGGQSEASNSDQLRTCRDCAVHNGHNIVDRFVYTDEKVSGTKRSRVGLDAFLKAASEGRFKVAYFHSLSRLARESVLTIPLVKRLVYVYGVRVITIVENIDTNRDGWELIVAIMSVVHEQQLKELSANVHRGQVGRILDGKACGDHCLGYSTVVAPGYEEMLYRSGPRPPRVYVIDDEERAWVIRIFHWFVKERRPIRWIVRELNRLGAPKDHRATTKNWHHMLVLRLLGRRKYIGIWPWGNKRNVRDPETGDVTQKDRPPEECEKWTRQLPHLRIIDDETFQAAQEILQENRDRHHAWRDQRGRLRGRRSNADAPHSLLSLLFECAQCEKRFHLIGTNSKYFICQNYKGGTCKCGTSIRRDLAERLILDEVGKRIRENPAWTEAVFQAVLAAWHVQHDELPGQLRTAECRLAQLETAIKRLLDKIEEGTAPSDVNERVTSRRRECADLEREVERLQNEGQVTGPKPTREWLQEKLQALGATLRETTPAAAVALRKLVGRRIVVHEVTPVGRKRKFLRGTFKITTAHVAEAVSEFGGVDAHQHTITEECVIDFRESSAFDQRALHAKALFDEGELLVVIGQKLPCPRSMVRKYLLRACELLGVELPDCRRRRSQLKRQWLEPPHYQLIADEAMRLWLEDLRVYEILERLGCDYSVFHAAVRYWHESRGLPVPDGRQRNMSHQRNRKKQNTREEKGDADAA